MGKNSGPVSIMSEFESAAIGLNGQLHSRIKWVRLSENELVGNDSTSSSWWPGFFYENYSDFIKDVNPRKFNMRIRCAYFNPNNIMIYATDPKLSLVYTLLKSQKILT